MNHSDQDSELIKKVLSREEFRIWRLYSWNHRKLPERIKGGFSLLARQPRNFKELFFRKLFSVFSHNVKVDELSKKLSSLPQDELEQILHDPRVIEAFPDIGDFDKHGPFHAYYFGNILIKIIQEFGWALERSHLAGGILNVIYEKDEIERNRQMEEYERQKKRRLEEEERKKTEEEEILKLRSNIENLFIEIGSLDQKLAFGEISIADYTSHKSEIEKNIKEAKENLKELGGQIDEVPSAKSVPVDTENMIKCRYIDGEIDRDEYEKLMFINKSTKSSEQECKMDSIKLSELIKELEEKVSLGQMSKETLMELKDKYQKVLKTQQDGNKDITKT